MTQAPARTALLTGLVAALLAAPSAAAAADDGRLSVDAAASALGTTPSALAERTRLGPERLRAFVSGAQDVGGLSGPQVVAVLRRPQLIPSVAVRAAFEPAPVAHAAASFPRRGCRTTGARVVFNSIAGFRLWTFSASKHWCWNSRRKRVRITPGSITVDVDIAQAAAIAGWDYKGLDEGGKSDYCYRYKGSGQRGAHATYRRGVMKYCPIRIGCANTRRPWVRIGVRWTGSAWANYGVG